MDYSEIVHLRCSGSEQWTSSLAVKSDAKKVAADFILDFNPVKKRVTAGTAHLAKGCFTPKNVDLARSSCDCQINDQIVHCRATAYDTDSDSVYKDEFSIDRATGKMTTSRTSTLNGQITSLELGEIQCANVVLEH